MQNTIHVVTGATGRTGLALVAYLKSQGCYVRAVAGNDKRVIPYLRTLADEVCQADVTKDDALLPAFANATYVYHLAGIVSIASKMDARLSAVNVGGTKRAVDACLKTGVKRLIFVGTAHVVPFSDRTSTLTEPAAYVPDPHKGAYAVSKALACQAVMDAVRDRGLDAVIALPSGITGGYERKRSNLGQMIIDVAERRLRVGVGGRYDFVDVMDVAKALCDLARVGVKGESYLVTGHIAAAKALMTYAAEAAGVKPPRGNVPLWLVMPIAWIKERQSLRRGDPLTFTPFALKTLTENCHFSHEKLTALTGYSPKPMKQSITEQVEYYFAHKDDYT
ncbi:MAG: NAD-dependent epimerase/dehydratase family protein [Clostridiales bacterium]|jgi:dihydroflavonol-4-reductase|nr:NAD-dependent epimerase/dehydratase family protein [Clostridiales bacterium]